MADGDLRTSAFDELLAAADALDKFVVLDVSDTTGDNAGAGGQLKIISPANTQATLVTDAYVGALASVAANTAHAAVSSGNPHSVTKAEVGLTNVEDTALSTWAGTTNITTLGTIATGVWQGTVIDHERGGLEADISAYDGLLRITGGASSAVTVTAFALTLLDDTTQGAMQTTLDVDPSGTDNSTAVTLAGTPDYITISGQVITRNAIDLSTDVTGALATGTVPAAQVVAGSLGAGNFTVTGTLSVTAGFSTDIDPATDAARDLGNGELRFKDAWVQTLSAGETATDTLILRGYDVDGTAYVDYLTITSANGPTADLAAAVTIGGNAILDASDIGGSVQGFDANTAKKNIANEYTRTQNFNATTLSEAEPTAWDLSQNQVTSLTLTGNLTDLTPSNPVDGAFYTLHVIQGGSGSYTITNYNSITFDVTPTLSTGVGDVDTFHFVCRGSTLYHSGHTPEGTDILSTGEAGGTKYLREDGDGTCSWQTPAGSGDLLADGTVPLTANWDVGAFTITGTQFISDIATGTAPFVVSSTTEVANLNAATATLATTVTTNANLTGHITSTGNAAILGSFTVAQLSTALSDATLSGNNAGDVTLAGTPDYITISGQVITRNAIDLSTDVTGALATGTVPASQVTAGTFGTGAFVFDNTVSGITTLTATTLAGTLSTATQNSVTTMTGLVTVGALNSGSITSGFGAIDNGASTITTTGAIAGGTLELTDSHAVSSTVLNLYNPDTTDDAAQDFTWSTDTTGGGAASNVEHTSIVAQVTTHDHATLASTLGFHIAIAGTKTFRASIDATGFTSVGTITGTTITSSGALELGHASDTTIARVSAGLVSIEGSNILMASNIGIADNNLLEVDGSPNAAEWAKFTANGIEGRTDAELIADLSLEVGVDIGYLGAPQNSQSVAYTLVLADQGKHILHPSADTTARDWTIPANSSVAYAIGTAITFINQDSAGVITIKITTDTMRLAGAGTTGDRTLAANGMATAIKVTSTEWIIGGHGLT